MVRSLDFHLGILRAADDTRDAAEKGMGRAMLLLLGDAVREQPKVPHDEGTLRGSGSAFVENRLIGTAPSEGSPTPSMTDNEPLGTDTITGVVGYNTPYAERLHEHPEFNFRETGTGGKYLSMKMGRNRELYLGEIARTIKQAER